VVATTQVADFTNVRDDTDGFRPRRVPDGDYRAKVTKVEDHTSKKTGNKQWVFTIVLEGRSRSSYPYYCGFAEKELWKIRNLLIAGGLTVPKKKVRVNPNTLVNKTIGVAMEAEEFEGKWKSTIMATFPASDVESTPSSSSSDDDAEDVDDATDDEDVEIEEI
jgi:hypothetical protein